MGGICVKPSGGSPRERRSSKLSSESRVLQSNSKNRAEVRTGSIDKRLNSSRRVRYDQFEKKKEGSGVIVGNISSIRTIPKAIEGEQVAAGWPSWLAEAAGEAVSGWLPRRADTFEKLDKIGQGTYSNVYKARDLINKKIVALKRVRFDNMDSESVKFMAREIVILRRLDHPNIIKLEGLVTSRTSCSLYLVLEYMEHDLTGLASLPGVKFTEPQVKCYMKQLLSGLDHCHTQGVLHRDIKGSNLLIDNHGILKIADFGLASFFDHRQNVPLTSRVVTLWYRPPELLLGATLYGVAVDLWSAGCILGELYAGKPIMPGRTEVEQLHRIFKLCGSPSDDYWTKSKLPHSTVFKPAQPYERRMQEAFKDFPSPAIQLMETLLAIDPQQRGTAALVLKSEFFTTKPHACDPSSLPRYPPSKEIDAKMRDEEARRQRAAGVKDQKLDKESKRPKEPCAVPAPDANAELVASIQERARSELLSKSKGFPIKQPAISTKDATKDVERLPPMMESYSGPLVAGGGWTQSQKKYGEISSHLTKSQMGKQISESTEEFMHTRKHEERDLPAGPRRVESGRASNQEPMMDGEVYKIHFSGPLVSSNVDRMLKDHERQIQEAGRRARLEKTRLSKLAVSAV
ncbi:probable serine/threonine-protein kinase At1g54610 isoform X2 [Cynara cardunculus var. scolymus]|uniref:probable serine/threonine-protein kinase At1g54610 isoform X2 n=1 Tax=Cynara cardunculus var. scolymus TaxID=59895 RepID=UPI000D62DFB2|nr:probable serine/threonine-protein kinase At1g54610 isoform X2 [Cynara cardunculus var. scolymus]